MKLTRFPFLSAAILGFTCAALALTSCNTMKGLGRDVQNLGRGIEKVTKKNTPDDYNEAEAEAEAAE